MRKLFEFIRTIYVAVLFVVLEMMAVNYYADSSPYTQARLLARSNQVAGGVRSLFAGVRHYFHLGTENRDLVERVALLEEQLARYREAATIERLESYLDDIGESKYHFATASVISNSINRGHNFITLNRGSDDGIVVDMSVLAPDGSVVGHIVGCTERYSVAVSVLNRSFRASAKIAGTDYSGSISWDGTSPYEVTLSELSKYAEPQVGQEVVTAGFTNIFPEDLVIGWIESVELSETRTHYTARVRLAADISALGDVIVVCNRDMEELRELKNSPAVERYNN